MAIENLQQKRNGIKRVYAELLCETMVHISAVCGELGLPKKVGVRVMQAVRLVQEDSIEEARGNIMLAREFVAQVIDISANGIGSSYQYLGYLFAGLLKQFNEREYALLRFDQEHLFNPFRNGGGFYMGGMGGFPPGYIPPDEDDPQTPDN